jgi:hypothetical protein
VCVYMCVYVCVYVICICICIYCVCVCVCPRQIRIDTRQPEWIVERMDGTDLLRQTDRRIHGTRGE